MAEPKAIDPTSTLFGQVGWCLELTKTADSDVGAGDGKEPSTETHHEVGHVVNIGASIRNRFVA
jgi:hypothetical protein